MSTLPLRRPLAPLRRPGLLRLVAAWHHLSTASSLSRLARQMAGLLQRARQAWQARQRRLQDRECLRQMSAHDLADLGLGRDQIDQVTGKGVLTPPR